MHALQLKPVCVSESLKKGIKFVKWDDVSNGAARLGTRAGAPGRAGGVGVGRGGALCNGRAGRDGLGAHRLASVEAMAGGQELCARFSVLRV